MGLFITAAIDEGKCLGLDTCGKCLAACPVNVFKKGKQIPTVDPENEDECTLCDLCLDVCKPDCIQITKEYEA